MKFKNIIYITSSFTLLASCNTLKNKPLEEVKSSNNLQSIDVAYLNKSIKPQDDFFMFSNGTWVVNNPVPPSESRWGSFNELELNNKKKLTIILDDLKTRATTIGTDAAILGNYYASLTNMEVRNKKGVTPIQTDLDRINTIKSKSDIIYVIAEQHMQGINSLFGFGVGQDLKNVNNNISYLSQGGISLPNRDYYTSENKKEVLAKYQKHVSNIFQLLSYSPEEADKMAINVIDFETKLASVMMAPAELRIPEKTYNKLNIEAATKLFGAIDFEVYLSSIGSNSFDSLIVSQPLFLEKTNEMISN